MDSMAFLATDSRSLDALKRQAASDPQQAIRAAAGQFEALFMRQLLKNMRDAMPKSGMWDSPGQSMYTEMLDQQMAQLMSKGNGGLAEVIARQLSRNVKGGVKAEDVVAPADGGSAAIGGATVQRATVQRATMPNGDADAGGVRRALAARATVSSAMPDLRNLSGGQAQFVERMWPHAKLAEQTTGVPAAYIIGQAALESGWGKREIRAADGGSSHNLFGIKAGRGWQGQVASATTTEFANGQPQRRVERFRAYGSYSEAFTDWAQMLSKSPRYAQVLRSASTVQGFAGGMQKAGYATDPNYGAKLERTINQTLMLKRLVV